MTNSINETPKLTSTNTAQDVSNTKGTPAVAGVGYHTDKISSAQAKAIMDALQQQKADFAAKTGGAPQIPAPKTTLSAKEPNDLKAINQRYNLEDFNGPALQALTKIADQDNQAPSVVAARKTLVALGGKLAQTTQLASYDTLNKEAKDYARSMGVQNPPDLNLDALRRGDLSSPTDLSILVLTLMGKLMFSTNKASLATLKEIQNSIKSTFATIQQKQVESEKKAEEAKEKQAEADKKSYWSKVFAWLGVAAMAIAGAAMIITGAGAVAGAAMLIGAVVTATDMVLKESGVYEKYPDFGKAMGIIVPIITTILSVVSICSGNITGLVKVAAALTILGGALKTTAGIGAAAGGFSKDKKENQDIMSGLGYAGTACGLLGSGASGVAALKDSGKAIAEGEEALAEGAKAASKTQETVEKVVRTAGDASKIAGSVSATVKSGLEISVGKDELDLADMQRAQKLIQTDIQKLQGSQDFSQDLMNAIMKLLDKINENQTELTQTVGQLVSHSVSGMQATAAGLGQSGTKA